MKRRAAPSLGFWMSLFLNMIFQGEWLMAALAMYLIHHFFKAPIFLVWICVSIWFIWSLAITLFVSWAASSAPSNNISTGQRSSERIKNRMK